MAMLPTTLEHDRKQAGWSIGQAAGRLGITVREWSCRELETRRPLAELRDVGPGSASYSAGPRRSLQGEERPVTAP